MGRHLLALAFFFTFIGQQLCFCEGKGYEKPLDCTRLECASYKVIHTQKEFEIRNYKEAVWMTFPFSNSTPYNALVDTGFNMIFDYIAGKNHETARMQMTVPMLADILGNSSYVFYFYVPKIYQKKPPLSDLARPVKLPPRNKYAAVRRYGGYMDDTNIAAEALALKKSLKGTRWQSAIKKKRGIARGAYYTVAGYNMPYEWENRVNEVIFWLHK